MRIRKLDGTSHLTVILALLPGAQPKDGGLAFIQHGDCKPIQFVLRRSFFRMLWILSLAKLNDPNVDPTASGIQRLEMLTKAYAIQGGTSDEIELDTVKHMVMDIRRDVGVAIDEMEARFGASVLDPKPAIIKVIRSHGYRVGNMSVALIDHVDDHGMPPS
jgi:hypothetical protein